MEINLVRELLLYIFYLVVVIGVILIFVNNYLTSRRLKQKYPDYTKAQRKFMLNTVERTDKLILQSLQDKYTEKKGKISRELQEVQRSKKQIVIHITYIISANTTRLVVFDSEKQHSFMHNKQMYNTGMIELKNIPLILL